MLLQLISIEPSFLPELNRCCSDPENKSQLKLLGPICRVYFSILRGGQAEKCRKDRLKRGADEKLVKSNLGYFS